MRLVVVDSERRQPARPREASAWRGRSRLCQGLLASLICALTLFAGATSAQASGGTAAVAWGSNGHYELGAGYRNFKELQPVSVVGLTEVVQVISAGQTGYALLSDGEVRSWGANFKEELGDGCGAFPVGEKEREGSAVPVTVVEGPSTCESSSNHPLTGVTQIAASYGDGTHALALVNDSEHEGEVATWGASEFGERGTSKTENGFEKTVIATPRDEAVFVPGLKHIVAVAAGGNSDYALQEEGGVTTLWAWGENAFGKLGIGPVSEPEHCNAEVEPKACVTTPAQVQIPPGVKVTAIDAGKESAYAVLSNGKVLAWGSDAHGQLGTDEKTGSLVSSNTPLYVCAVGATAPCTPSAELEGIVNISAGEKFALALTSGGEVVGWGANLTGELTETSSEECSPTETTCQKIVKKLSGLEHVSALSSGNGYSLALIEGKVYGWGLNESGQLGLGLKEGPELCGSQNCSRMPLEVKGLPPVSGIAAGQGESGESASIAILSSGSGPAPLMTVTPEAGGAKLTWTFGSPEKFTVDIKPVESKSEWTRFATLTGKSCSVASPCSETIKPLESKTKYLIKLATFEGKKLTSERIAQVKPE